MDSVDGRIVLVRHAQPVLRADVPAPGWELSAEGRTAVALLAADPVFDGVRAVVSSPEPKALATAEPIAARLGLEVQDDAGLRETERPEPFPLLGADEHRALVGRYLAGEAMEGWEPLEDAGERMRRVVRRLLGEAGDVAVVSHGRALAALLGLAPEEWAAIGLPATAVADARTLRLVEPFG